MLIVGGAEEVTLEVLLVKSRYDALSLARRTAQILDERKVQDITILNVSQTLQITDCFVLGTGLNPRHIRSAGDYLIREFRNEGIRRTGLEGYQEARWLLIDLSDVIVHLFLPEQRQHYDLELLWGDCPRVEWDRDDPAAASGG